VPILAMARVASLAAWAEALERQELFINQAIVTPALGILWEFFRHGRLSWCGAFVNLKTGHVRPLPVDN